MDLYKIADWNKHYENHRTRDLKHLDWIRIPTKMDGDGYTELLDHPDGAAHLGAWLAILLIASRCEPRGTLVRSNGLPHDPVSMSRISRVDPAIFRETLARLYIIGWIECIPNDCNNPAQSRANPAQSRADVAESRARGEEKRGEEKRGEEKRHTQSVRVTSSEISTSKEFGNFWARWGALTHRIQRHADALRAWIGVVEPGEEPAVMECLERYGASDEVLRGVVSNPEKWLYEQARDDWRGDWPAPKSRLEIQSEALRREIGDD